MKKLLILLGLALILACGGIGVAVYYWMKGPAEAATYFVQLLGEGKTQEAYASAAPLLRQQQNEADFTVAVKKLGLTDAASASWNHINIKNNQAEVSGTVSTKTGAAIPTEVKLIKESDGWRVSSISAPLAGAGDLTMPSDAELRKLAAATLGDFDQAVQAKDFKPFHAKISKLWQAESTPAGLQKIFQEFIDKNISLAGVQDVPPEFSEPPAIKDKMLTLNGYSLLKTQRATFKLDYVYEHPGWKLAGIRVNVSPIVANEAPVPSDAEVRKLVAASLTDFDQAVQAKDFKAFHAKVAKLLQDKTNPDSLRKIFQAFIDKEIRLEGIADAPLEFSEPPAIQDGILKVAGFSLLNTQRVTFKLDYVYEHPTWKLVNIQVNVTPLPKKE